MIAFKQKDGKGMHWIEVRQDDLDYWIARIRKMNFEVRATCREIRKGFSQIVVCI